MKISYSAPAKVILSGEHGVVYGKPALASAINLRLTCTIEGTATIKDKNIRFVTDQVKSYIRRNHNFPDKPDPKVVVKSEIPSGRGLGSSAAYSVAVAAAVYEYYTGQAADKSIVNDIAYRIEKKFHTNPSGVDVSASCHGGLIYYRKEFEFLKTISALNIKIPKKIEDGLFLIDSGKPKESTAKMVQMVGKKYNGSPDAYRSYFENMERITKRMVVALVKEDSLLFVDSIKESQKILSKIGVVSEKAQNILKKLTPYGAGKITGAGGSQDGSGYILFFTAEPKELSVYLSDKNIRYIKFSSDYRGLLR